MQGLAHQLIAGVATGGIYAAVALALVMIYQATHHVNFAQGEMATLSTFLAWSMIQAGFPYWVAFFATIAVSFVIGVLVERLLMRPVQNAPVLTHVGVFIGLLARREPGSRIAARQMNLGILLFPLRPV